VNMAMQALACGRVQAIDLLAPKFDHTPLFGTRQYGVS